MGVLQNRSFIIRCKVFGIFGGGFTPLCISSPTDSELWTLFFFCSCYTKGCFILFIFGFVISEWKEEKKKKRGDDDNNHVQKVEKEIIVNQWNLGNHMASLTNQTRKIKAPLKIDTRLLNTCLFFLLFFFFFFERGGAGWCFFGQDFFLRREVLKQTTYYQRMNEGGKKGPHQV